MSTEQDISGHRDRGSVDRGRLRTPPRDAGDDQLAWEALDAAPDGIIVADPAGQILVANAQSERLFGYERTQLVGRRVEDLLPERFHVVHRAHRIGYREDPRSRPMGAGLALLGRREDGSEFPVEISLSPLRSEAGLLVIASIRDITDRLAAEAERRRTYDLLNATRDGILMFDAETLRFTFANEGALDQVGYSHAELLSMTMLDIAPEYTEERLRDLLAPLQPGDSTSTLVTTVHRRRDGTEIPVEIALQAGSVADGQPGVFVKVVRDIRDRLNAEDQVRRADQALRMLEDRERIGRDLHDTVVQRLFAAGMSLQAAAALSAEEEIAERIGSVVDQLDQTIREIRTAIYGLQGPGPATGLRSQILAVISEERAALGAEPQLVFNGLLDLIPDVIAEQLLATLREALSNVARHAAATTIAIGIEAGDDVLLSVLDDGVGIPDEAPEGNGLRNMAERARQLGGGFEAAPAAGRGTRLEWRVPNPHD